MSENFSLPSHIRIPRSLLRDPLWSDLPLAYQHIFLVLVDKVCFKPQKFDDHGVLIDLLPGQICISERDLLKFCNKYVTRNDIQRAIKKFILYKFVSQEVRHRKSILTITHRDTYELITKSCEPRSEPNLSQTRAKLEPESNKENNEDINNNPPTSRSVGEEESNIIKPDFNKSVDSNQKEERSFKKTKSKNTSFEAYALLEYFSSSWKSHFPSVKNEIKNDQARYFDKLLKEYTTEQIKKAIDWSHKDHFWGPKVQNPSYLHKKFPEFFIKSEKGPMSSSQGPPSRAILGGERQTEYDDLF